MKYKVGDKVRGRSDLVVKKRYYMSDKKQEIHLMTKCLNL